MPFRQPDWIVSPLSQTTMPPKGTKRKAPAEGPTTRSSRVRRLPAPTTSSSRARRPPTPIRYEDTTDRSLIDRPVDSHIHDAMSEAWAIYEDSRMHTLFDAVSPVRLYKRGTVFNVDESYPSYGSPNVADITESDSEGPLQPYMPENYTYVQFTNPTVSLTLICGVSSPSFRFQCDVTLESFMNWTNGQLHEIKYGRTRKSRKKQRLIWNVKTTRIPVPYARIVHQFLLEDQHGKVDTGHESLRRWTYAQKMLDEFGKELDAFEGTEAQFRSESLTPVLQRQLKGVPDDCARFIRNAIAPHDAKPTISQVTSFYLGLDPLDPIHIPSYRRNLVYIREARWHLAILMGKADVRSIEDFNCTIYNQIDLMNVLKNSPPPCVPGVPPFNEAEVFTIVYGLIEEFFEVELSCVVCEHCPFVIQLLTTSPDSLTFLRRLWRRGRQGPVLHQDPICSLQTMVCWPPPPRWFPATTLGRTVAVASMVERSETRKVTIAIFTRFGWDTRLRLHRYGKDLVVSCLFSRFMQLEFLKSLLP